MPRQGMYIQTVHITGDSNEVRFVWRRGVIPQGFCAIMGFKLRNWKNCKSYLHGPAHPGDPMMRRVKAHILAAATGNGGLPHH